MTGVRRFQNIIFVIIAPDQGALVTHMLISIITLIVVIPIAI